MQNTCYTCRHNKVLAVHCFVYSRVGHGSLFQNPTQPKISGPTQKSSPDQTQPIIDTWYGILGYTENFIQQL